MLILKAQKQNDGTYAILNQFREIVKSGVRGCNVARYIGLAYYADIYPNHKG